MENIFDHHAVVFEYKNGGKTVQFLFASKTRLTKDVTDYVIGTKGCCGHS